MADILHKVGIKSLSLDDAYKALTTALALPDGRYLNLDADGGRALRSRRDVSSGLEIPGFCVNMTTVVIFQGTRDARDSTS